MGADIEARFWAKVEPTGFCWNWTGHRNKTGHGRFHPTRNRSIAAHRFAYELLVGPIPEGLHLDHLCRNTACVNPDHLEPVTLKENVLRGFGITAQAARATHCKNGHEFTPENTIVRAKGWRGCRECKREWQRESRKSKPRPKQAWKYDKAPCPICGKEYHRKAYIREHIELVHPERAARIREQGKEQGA